MPTYLEDFWYDHDEREFLVPKMDQFLGKSGHTCYGLFQGVMGQSQSASKFCKWTKEIKKLTSWEP